MKPFFNADTEADLLVAEQARIYPAWSITAQMEEARQVAIATGRHYLQAGNERLLKKWVEIALEIAARLDSHKAVAR